LIAYVILGLLTWTTISDTRIRAGTLVILGLFAFKSWVRRRDVMHSDKPEGEESKELKADS
jgi:hypothetical protein